MTDDVCLFFDLACMISTFTSVPTRFIFDTNIWLDWFVFEQADDSPMMCLKAFFVARPDVLVWMNAAMWDEWTDVLARKRFDVPPERQASILVATREMVEMLPNLPPPPSFTRIRCADVDDQVFIDTALAQRVEVLLSKDKHLLRLAKRAKTQGVTIATPEQWLRTWGSV